MKPPIVRPTCYSVTIHALKPDGACGHLRVAVFFSALRNQLVGMATDDGGNSSEFSQPVGLGQLEDVIFSDRFQQ